MNDHGGTDENPPSAAPPTQDDPSVGAPGEDAVARGPGTDAEAILGRMTDAFFAVDDDWRLTYVNEHARPILEAAMGSPATDGSLIGTHLWESIPSAVETTFYTEYHRAMETQSPVTFEAHFEPLETWFEVRAYPSDSGLSVYFQDVTARHERERLLTERERVLREVHDVTSDTERSFEAKIEALIDIGCEVLDTDFGSLSRVRSDVYTFEVVRSPAGEVSPGDVVDLSTTSCERAIESRETLVLADIESDAPALACREGNVDLDISAYLGAPVVVDGEVDGTFCFYDREPRESFTDWEVALVDLLAQWIGYERTRRLTYQRLQHQNEQLEEFASLVSHDLRNPLTVLQSSLSLAEETGAAEHFERSQRAVERMNALVEDLLALARAGEAVGDRETVDLVSVVNESWTVVSTSAASLVVDCDGTVAADASRLQQLFENLFRNAVEHAGPGVTVTVGGLPDGFYVADDGPGIPPAERDEVTEVGVSTDPSGTGMGLHIVENIVMAHDWSLDVVESDAGGARFEISDVRRKA